MLGTLLRKPEDGQLQGASDEAAVAVGAGRRQRSPQRPPSSRLPFSARVQQRTSRRVPHLSSASPASQAPPAPPLQDSNAPVRPLSAPEPPSASPNKEDDLSKDFFASFRSSFHAQGRPAPAVVPSQHYATLFHKLIVWEHELRDQLCRHEAEELTALVHRVEEMLLPCIPALRDVSPLDIVRREKVYRWSIVDDYYQLLLDATELQEMVQRRALCTQQEPQARKRLEDGEVPHWIESRRLQVMRENRESAKAQNEEQLQRLAYFEHLQQQLYQIFLLEEGERADRMEVERLQRLHVGGLAEVIAKEYRRVRVCQLRYEAARHPLNAHLSYEIAAEEARHRSMVIHEQTHVFKQLQAAEVRCYFQLIR